MSRGVKQEKNGEWVPFDDALTAVDTCLECLEELPSMNFKNGKPYFYCPECGRTDLKE